MRRRTIIRAACKPLPKVRQDVHFSESEGGVSASTHGVVGIDIGGHLQAASLSRPPLTGRDELRPDPLLATVGVNIPPLQVADGTGRAAIR
jgi:hypothetical protein